MTLVLPDTSVRIRHFRRPDPELQSLVSTDRILCHPLIVLELGCGTPPVPRGRTLGDLGALRQAVVATTEETLDLIGRRRLYDQGCGAVDMMLLASALLTPDARLWTDDRSLGALALRLGVARDTAGH